MITKTKQNWTVGQQVKVGFLTLLIIGIKSVKDGLPDIYQLSSLDGLKKYEFIPHNGLYKIS
jgi:hypothetical protein